MVICSSLLQIRSVDWIEVNKRKPSFWMCICGRATFFTPCLCGKKRTGDGMTEEGLKLRSFGMTVYPFESFFGTLRVIVQENFVQVPEKSLFQEFLDSGMVGIRNPPPGHKKYIVFPHAAAAPGLDPDLSVHRKTLVKALAVRSSFCRLYFIRV